MLALRQVAHVLRQRSPTAAGLEHARQHADVHVDGAVRDSRVVARALEVGDRRRRDRRQRRIAEMLLDEAQALLLELDRSRRATHSLGGKVRFDRFRQPFRSLLVGGQQPAAGVLNQLALALLRLLQVRRAETLPVTLPGDGEVCPVLAAAFPETHTRNSPAFDSPSDAETDRVSTAHARMNSSRSARRYRTARPNRTKRGPLPR